MRLVDLYEWADPSRPTTSDWTEALKPCIKFAKDARRKFIRVIENPDDLTSFDLEKKLNVSHGDQNTTIVTMGEKLPMLCVVTNDRQVINRVEDFVAANNLNFMNEKGQLIRTYGDDQNKKNIGFDTDKFER